METPPSPSPTSPRTCTTWWVPARRCKGWHRRAEQRLSSTTGRKQACSQQALAAGAAAGPLQSLLGWYRCRCWAGTAAAAGPVPLPLLGRCSRSPRPLCFTPALPLQVFELVKNSLRAVHDRFEDSDNEPPPIRLVVAEGEEDITIKVHAFCSTRV